MDSDSHEKSLMSWQKLLTADLEEIAAGSVFRVKAQWPYEEFVDLMLVYLPGENTAHALIVCTGMKAGRVLVKLPLVSDCGGRAISKDWIVENWNEWIYPDSLIEDVLVTRRYEVFF